MTNEQGTVIVVHDVKPGKNTLGAELSVGTYTVSRGRGAAPEE